MVGAPRPDMPIAGDGEASGALADRVQRPDVRKPMQSDGNVEVGGVQVQLVVEVLAPSPHGAVSL